MILCRLCGNAPAIKNSHVLRALVFRAIKEDSPTGFLRNPNNPNLRVQDGDKHELLCAQCEEDFGKSERQFNMAIFEGFHQRDQDHFEYGPWLHYFMTSIAWRTLALDLPGFVADVSAPRSVVASLIDAEQTMRNYLLGANNLAGILRNHAIAWTAGHVASARLAAAGPNALIRRSAFGYTVLDRRHGYSAVLHNLAGFMCFLIIKGSPRDNWQGTKINPNGGKIKQPQRVESWLIGELLGCIIESGPPQMSEGQMKKVGDAIAKNPDAAGLRFQQLDTSIQVRQ